MPSTSTIHGFTAPSAFTTSTLTFSLNSTRISIDNPNPDLTLLEFIRAQGLKGTKLACGEGGCGACTVVVGVLVPSGSGGGSGAGDGEAWKPRYRSVNACLAPLISVHGAHVLTIEGIGSSKNPHPIAERIAKSFGSQCGFCTPGIVMAYYAMFRNGGYGKLTMKEIEEGSDGNLCRCTGYRPILDAVKTFAVDAPQNDRITYSSDSDSGTSSPPQPVTPPEQDPVLPIAHKEASAVEGHKGVSVLESKEPVVCGKGGDCCRVNGKGCGAENEKSTPEMIPGIPRFVFKPYDPACEPLFPPWLKRLNLRNQDLVLVQKRKIRKLDHDGDDGYPEGAVEEVVGSVWLRPGSLDSLLACVEAYPQAKVRAGNSETGIEKKFKGIDFPVSIFVSDHLTDLATFECSEKGMRVGSALPLTDVVEQCKKALAVIENEAGRQIIQATLDNMAHFAGTQIRNTATLAGNITTASPISDLNPVWVASKAVLHYLDEERKERTVNMRDFFLGYRKTALPTGAIVTGLEVPFPDTSTTVLTRAYKQSKRKDDDIAIVTCCLRVDLDANKTVQDVALVYGGMGPTTMQSKQTEAYLCGKTWGDEDVLFEAMRVLAAQDYALPYSVLGGMGVYRKSLAIGFLAKFWSETCEAPPTMLSDAKDSDVHRGVSSGQQDLEDVDLRKTVGQSVPHLSAMKQATGEAEYTDDLPPIHGELHAALILSQKPRAKLVRIDTTKARAMEGVVDIIFKEDLPGPNNWCPPAMDDLFFADQEVFTVGQIIGAVAADTKHNAQAAAKAVEIQYEEMPYILTIDEAIAAESYFKPRPVLHRGDLAEIDKADYVIEGEYKMGGQEHFYLGTQGAVVIPHPEDDEMTVWSATQNPTETQVFVAAALGIPQNRVVTRVKRLGGGFGGAETRSIPMAVTAAVLAKKLRRPIRLALDRDEDMIITGQRHPFSCTYKIGFQRDGKLVGLHAKVYNNGGWSQDLSQAVLERAMTHIDNCSRLDVFRIEGRICKTNTVSNTAFRGFGGPQGMMMHSAIMCAVADKVGMRLDEVMDRNLYKEGERTHFGQPLLDWNVPAMIDQIRQSAELDTRRAAVEQFNAQHKWKKRGMALIPTKFGISFTALMLNQGHALIHIYSHDGSIGLFHGGVEMGQGLHTKMAQVCATELGVDLEKIFIMETNTMTAANTSATAASASSDLNGMAIKNACDQLNARLAPYREKMVGASWEQLCHAAYFDRVDLSATGFYKTPDIGFDWQTQTGHPFFYFTQGVGVSEVEVDCLTGSFTVLRADVVMDIGRSINPSVDIGQVEGAWLQGMGLTTMEESLWLNNGQLFTRGPGAYKIPSFLDVPQDFRVAFLKGPARKIEHLKTIQSSKGVGEPPLFLGATVFFAIRDAIASARRDHGHTRPWNLYSPATPERIRLAIGDPLLAMAQEGGQPKEGEKSFFVSIY